MKMMALIGAAALAFGTIAATPVEAQRHGWHDGGGYRGHGYRRDYRRGYRGNYRGRGWRGGYGRSRVICRVRPGRHGPIRRCFRVAR